MIVLLWILSILLFLGGLGALFNRMFIWALILIAGAIVLFPPFGIVT